MFIRKRSIEKYKVLEDININFSEKPKHNVFPIISINGGVKSTLLHMVFAFLNCAFKRDRQEYLVTLLDYFDKKDSGLNQLIKFEIEYDGQIVNLEFLKCKNGYNGLNFDSILTLRELRNRRISSEYAVRNIQHLNSLENDIKK